MNLVSDIAVKRGHVVHGVTAVASPGSSLYRRVTFESRTDVTMTYDTGVNWGTRRPHLWNLNICGSVHRGASVVKIIPTRCNNCGLFFANAFTLHVSGDNLTHHQEYMCCIWPQVSRHT